jgi:hypothetical protein
LLTFASNSGDPPVKSRGRAAAGLLSKANLRVCPRFDKERADPPEISGCKRQHSPSTPPAMARIVMKFGGTSVADIDRIRNVARHVKREVDAGNEVAVVVSAMAGKTNKLVDLTARRRRCTMRANMTPSSPPANR